MGRGYFAIRWKRYVRGWFINQAVCFGKQLNTPLSAAFQQPLHLGAPALARLGVGKQQFRQIVVLGVQVDHGDTERPGQAADNGEVRDVLVALVLVDAGAGRELVHAGQYSQAFLGDVPGLPCLAQPPSHGGPGLDSFAHHRPSTRRELRES